MPLTYGVLLAAALLLVASGLVTLRSPAAATAALAGLGVRVPGGGRLLAVAELAVAALFLARGGAVGTAALGLAYVGFAGVVALGRTRGLADCGCFGGAAQVPPSRLHVAVTLLVGATALGTVLAGAATPAVPAALSGSVWAGVPLLAGALLCAWLLHLAMSALAALPRTGAVTADEGPRLFSLTVPPRPVPSGAAR